MVRILFGLFALVMVWHRLESQGLCSNPTGSVEERRASYASSVGFLNEETLSAYDISVDDTWYTIGLAIHVVRFEDGSGEPSPDYVSNLVNALNAGYSEVHITFEVLSLETIDSDYYTNGTYAAQEQLADEKNVDETRYANLYVVAGPTEDRATFGETLRSWMNQWFEPSCQFQEEYIIVRSNLTDLTTVIHEMGHYLGLWHTFDQMLGKEADFPPYQAGDLIPDTPPSKGPFPSCSDELESERLLALNYMSGPSGCRSQFSQIQVQSIRRYLIVARSDLRRGRMTLLNSIGGQNAGGMLRWTQLGASTDVSSGSNSLMQVSPVVSLQTLAERFENFQGGQQIHKHHDWNGSSSLFQLGRSTSVVPNAIQNAQFDLLSPATVQSLGLEPSQGLQIGMRDPWYLHSDGTQPDEFFPYASPHYPTGAYGQTSGGVFLDQTVQSGVFYSVSAPTQTVDGIDWVFQNWTASGADGFQATSSTTPIVFRQAGANVTATYKAHLASNASSVLANNGQRRLATQAFSDQTVLLYSSAGEIWASVKTGPSGSFGNEVRISTGNGNNDLPSITGRLNKEHAVWRRDNGGGTYTIYYAQRNNGVWSAPTVAGTAYGIAPVPLVTLKADYGYPWNDPPVYILYNKYSTLYQMRRSTNNGVSWTDYATLTQGLAQQSVSTIELFDGIPTYFSMSYNKAYDNSYSIYYRDYYGYWSGEAMVPSSSQYLSYSQWSIYLYMIGSNARNSQTLRYDGRRFFAFAKDENYEDMIWAYNLGYQERDPYGNWSAAFILTDLQGPASPSLAVLSGNRPVMEWTEGYSRYRAQRNAQGQWSVTYLGGNYDPQLSVSGGEPASYVTEVSRGSAGGLHTIVPQSSPITRVVSNSEVSSSVPLTYARMLSVIDTATGATYSIRIRQAKVGDRPLSFGAVNDTLPGITRENFFSFASTASRLAQSDLDTVTAQISTFSKGWSKHDENLNLNARLSAELPVQSMRTNFDPKGKSLLVQIPPAEVRGKTISLQLQGDLPQETENTIYTITHIFSRERAEDKARFDPKKSPDGNLDEVDAGLPEEFALYQSYPNPFNPSTTIAFGLDKDAYVSIEVFDLLGRMIATLRNGQMMAGYHTAVWTPDGLPTGTYVCRLRATESDGTMKTRTMRMQYVR